MWWMEKTDHMMSMTVRKKKRKDEIKISVGPFRNSADYKACVDIQQEAFDHRDMDFVPISMLITASRAGGILLGAYSGLGDMIGFTFSILGTNGGKLAQHCCLLVTKAAYKNFDIGFKLQTVLRKETLNRQIKRITCTFDPMQPLHSYFFLGKLGFYANAYEENFYGEAPSRYVRGLPADRMTAAWDIEDEMVIKRLENGPPPRDFRKELKCIPVINRLKESAPGLFVSSTIKMDCEEESIFFEIPYNLPEIKNRDLSAALEWQRNLRQVFNGYYKKGYSAIDFWGMEQDGQLRAGYLLGKRNS
jgi:predicted GNAT superfamily acetyltransferase